MGRAFLISWDGFFVAAPRAVLVVVFSRVFSPSSHLYSSHQLNREIATYTFFPIFFSTRCYLRLEKLPRPKCPSVSLSFYLSHPLSLSRSPSLFLPLTLPVYYFPRSPVYVHTHHRAHTPRTLNIPNEL